MAPRDHFYRSPQIFNGTAWIGGLLLASVIVFFSSFFALWLAQSFVTWNFWTSLVLWVGFLVALLVGKHFSQARGHAHSGSYIIGGLLITLVGLYFGWAAYLYFFLKTKIPFWSWSLQPELVWNALVKFLPLMWKLVASNAKNSGDAIQTLLGYAVDLGLRLYFGYKLYKLDEDDLYCKICKTWCEPPETIALINVSLEPELEQTAQTGIADWFHKIEFIADEGSFVELKAASCGSCNQLSTLTAVRYDATTEKRVFGWTYTSKEVKERIIFANLLIPHEALVKINDDFVAFLDEIDNLEDEDEDE